MKSNLVATQTSTSLSSNQGEVENYSALDIAFLSVLSLVITLSVSISIYDLISKRKQPAQIPKSCTDPICTGCQYFSNNRYLQCALQPTLVMTEESIDCKDYCSIDKVKRTTLLSPKMVLPLVSRWAQIFFR
jgi:hypothetical protein